MITRTTNSQNSWSISVPTPELNHLTGYRAVTTTAGSNVRPNFMLHSSARSNWQPQSKHIALNRGTPTRTFTGGRHPHDHFFSFDCPLTLRALGNTCSWGVVIPLLQSSVLKGLFPW